MSENQKTFQVSTNGPLSADAIARLNAIKSSTGMSYATLGSKVGLSGTFLYNLMNKGMNVGTQHIKRMEEAVRRMEAGEDLEVEHPVKTEQSTLTHTYHLRPDLQVSLDLPRDLSEKEAERLSLFLRSLPTA
ncbi:MAG: hypothetical protein ACO1OD_11960 [Croceibacterium sp.]